LPAFADTLIPFANTLTCFVHTLIWLATTLMLDTYTSTPFEDVPIDYASTLIAFADKSKPFAATLIAYASTLIHFTLTLIYFANTRLAIFPKSISNASIRLWVGIIFPHWGMKGFPSSASASAVWHLFGRILRLLRTILLQYQKRSRMNIYFTLPQTLGSLPSGTYYGASCAFCEPFFYNIKEGVE
jgi:hypothetical protein